MSSHNHRYLVLAVGSDRSGFGLIELLVGVGLLFTLFLLVSGGLLSTFSMNRLAEEQTQATQLAEEGLDAVRSIRNKDWASITTGTKGLSTAGNSWSFSGTSDTWSKFTRQVVIDPVQRNGGGTIVTSGGTVDANVFKVTSTVSWSFTPSRQNSVVSTTYLTNFAKAISNFGNWASPSRQTTYNNSSNRSGLAIATDGNYVYLSIVSGNPSFLVLDVSNPATPTLVGSTNLAATANDLVVSGNYVYAAGSGNSAELQIVDVSVKTAPSVVGTFNAAGNSDGLSVFVSGNTAYLSRSRSTDPEVYLVDVTTKNAPVSISSVNLNENPSGTGTGNEIFKLGNYLYVASDADNAEVQIINITIPGTPSAPVRYDLSGTSNGLSVLGFDQTIIVGRTGGNIVLLNVTNPTAPTVRSTYTGFSGNITDLDLANSNQSLFAVGTPSSNEFQVINISTLTAPVLLGTVNTPASLINVVYSATLDRAFASSTYLAGQSYQMAVFRPN